MHLQLSSPPVFITRKMHASKFRGLGSKYPFFRVSWKVASTDSVEV